MRLSGKRSFSLLMTVSGGPTIERSGMTEKEALELAKDVVKNGIMHHLIGNNHILYPPHRVASILLKEE